MKNLLFVLSIAMLAAGCSSGTTVADLPSNVTNSFRGSFQNSPGTQRGTVVIDIVDTNGVVSGNIIFATQDDVSNCLRNAAVTGTSTGFNLNVTADQTGQQFTTTITERGPDVETTTTSTSGVETTTTTAGELISEIVVLSSSGQEGTFITTLGNGNVVTRVTTAASQVSGTLNMQFTISNQGNTIAGTYTTTGDICSNQTGSGTMTLSR